MLSSTPMSPDAFYQAFLSILQVHGFVAVPAGNVIKIVPDANARTMPGNDLPDRVSSTSDEIVTQVIAVKNVNAAQLVPILRPLMPQYGHLVAYPASNILIISDRAGNVNRIMRIIRRIDQAGDADVEIMPLQNASRRRNRARHHHALSAAAGAGRRRRNPLKVVADERSNSVLVSGEQAQRLRIKALIAHLDTPLENGGDTQVRYLQLRRRREDRAEAEGADHGRRAGRRRRRARRGRGGPRPAPTSSTMIWADPETNALVITAPPKIDALADDDHRQARHPPRAGAGGGDHRRVSAEQERRARRELGRLVERATARAFRSAASSARSAASSHRQPGAASIDNPASSADAARLIATGTTFGIGRIATTGMNFAAMLRACAATRTPTCIATPSAITMDNQEAELKVAQEVPFLTGQFTNTGGGNNGSVNPFQTDPARGSRHRSSRSRRRSTKAATR